MDRKERQEYIRSLQKFSCPIPQYEETRKKVMDWNRKQEESRKSAEK